MAGNVYHPHPLMINSGTFWRCDHGSTGMAHPNGDNSLSPVWVGCRECYMEEGSLFHDSAWIGDDEPEGPCEEWYKRMCDTGHHPDSLAKLDPNYGMRRVLWDWQCAMNGNWLEALGVDRDWPDNAHPADILKNILRQLNVE